MPRPQLPRTVRRDQPVTAMVTAPEKEAIERVATELGMSRSNAIRYLINRAIADHFTPNTGDNT